ALSDDPIRRLHYRRLALAKLPDKEIVAKLFDEYGPRVKDRPGGYTRGIKRHQPRPGGAGPTPLPGLPHGGGSKGQNPAPPPAPAAGRGGGGPPGEPPPRRGAAPPEPPPRRAGGAPARSRGAGEAPGAP